MTGSGGTNHKCLAANAGSEWRCLMAQYIMPHVETPIFVMNAAYDAWQMGNVLKAECTCGGPACSCEHRLASVCC